MKRNGEKLGWIGGWSGGFIWVVILSIVMLVQAKSTQGGLGLALAGLAGILIMVTAPWKHPDTPYWKLMLPVYVMFAACLVWAAWSYGGLEGLGINRWNTFIILPILIPFGTVGRKRWNDGEP